MRSGLSCLNDYVVNLSGFEERSKIGKCNKVSTEIYDRFEDEFLVLVKSNPHSENVEKSRIDQEMENLINLRHPCIAGPIAFVFPIESDSSHGLKIVRLYCESCSLTEVLSVCPIWWTSTVRAEVVAGIVLALRFAHSLQLVHGHLTANNILFDSDHNVQIVDFQTTLFELRECESEGEGESEDETQLGGFSRDKWTPTLDVDALVSILHEILVERSAKGQLSFPRKFPRFLSTMIKSRSDSTSKTR
jgi:serine/threonine protein kinase